MSDLVYNAKQAFTSVKKTVLNRSEMEQKVRNATNSETWGASSTLLIEIAESTFRREENEIIWRTLDGRFQHPNRNWRHLYKSLTLMEYVAIHGASHCRDLILERSYAINSLSNYNFVDEEGIDRGLNVREKSKKLMELVRDQKHYDEERKKASSSKGKFVGLSAGEHYSPPASSYSSSSYDRPSAPSSTAKKASAPIPTYISGSEDEKEPSKTAAKPRTQTNVTSSSSSTTKKPTQQSQAQTSKAPAVGNLLDLSDLSGFAAPSATTTSSVQPTFEAHFPSAPTNQAFDPFSQPSAKPTSSADLLDEFATLRVSQHVSPQTSGFATGGFDPFASASGITYAPPSQDFFANVDPNTVFSQASAPAPEKKQDGLSSLIATHSKLVDLSNLDKKPAAQTVAPKPNPAATMTLSGKPIQQNQTSMNTLNSYRPQPSTNPSMSSMSKPSANDPFSSIDPLKSPPPQKGASQSYFDPFGSNSGF
eukprot:TRINITY_DN1558_c0_g1_i2.p1 TRINITY_DN1558_c0_g1~~TRINITY_DN1558_c0_g1_i2.p1  ORF type:complete len:479 (-),score=115.92 TRINITY_DN1558_c0_g1_i2:250-1686(-)